MANVILHLSDGRTHLEIEWAQQDWPDCPDKGQEVVFELASGERLYLEVAGTEYVFRGKPIVLCRMTHSEARHVPALRELGFEDAPFPRLLDESESDR